MTTVPNVRLHTAYSAGPWVHGAQGCIFNGERTICEVRETLPPGTHGFDLERSANAALIASAPDLLDLAFNFLGECAECGGEGEVERGDDPEHGWTEPCKSCEDIRAVIARATPHGLYRKTEPKPAEQEQDDDIAF